MKNLTHNVLTAVFMSGAFLAANIATTGAFLAATLSEAQPTPAVKKPATIAQRKENQKDRIAQGVKSGQLTAGETAKLEKKEAAVNGETRTDRAANGGTLTAAEKKQVNRQQNRLSGQIYADKHNAVVQ